jgi:hypothetical protein
MFSGFGDGREFTGVSATTTTTEAGRPLQGLCLRFSGPRDLFPPTAGGRLTTKYGMGSFIPKTSECGSDLQLTSYGGVSGLIMVSTVAPTR